MTDAISFRPLNVALRPNSAAAKAYAAAARPPEPAAAGADTVEDALAAAHPLADGFKPQPGLDLKRHPGRLISDLVFTTRYLGGEAAWLTTDRQNIDRALSAVMTEPRLENVIAQYYQGPISSTMLPSAVVDGALGPKFFKDDVEATVTGLFTSGGLPQTGLADTVVCLVLPRGVVLVDGLSTDSDLEVRQAASAHPRHRRPVLVDDDQVDSLHGLGGYHGSVHAGATTVYYAVSVFSEGHNGIVAFDAPWKNVVATHYHELCEARTDPDVEDVIRTGDASKLGWYSRRGGEIGDIPMELAGAHLSLVMQEATLQDGTTAPLQLQWSNRAHGPEAL